MAVDLSQATNRIVEEWLTLPQAAELLPRRRRGRKVSKTTLYRWAKYGLGGVYLQVWQVGGGLCTTRAALSQFFEELTRQKGLRRGKPAQRPADPGLDAKLRAHGLLD
jgi:hypothetical protein